MQSSWALEEGRYGRRLVVMGRWSDTVLDAVLGSGAKELELNYARGWEGDDVAWLRQVPHLEAIDIVHRTIMDISPVNGLHQLRYLGVSTYCKTRLDFSNWPQLEECALVEWRPGAASLFEHQGVRRLVISKYLGTDFSPFSGMGNLRELRLLSPSRLQSCRGVGSLERLTLLEMSRASKLDTLVGIEELSCLQRLELHSCKKIASIVPVASLSHLTSFYCCDCGRIDSIQPLATSTDLEEFLFHESTHVLDGDLFPLLGLPSLRVAVFAARAHYSHTPEEIDAALSG